MKWMSTKRLSQGEHFLTGQWTLSRKPASTKLSHVTPRQGPSWLCSVLMVPLICCYFYSTYIVSCWVGLAFCFLVPYVLPPQTDYEPLETRVRSYFLLPFQHLLHHLAHSKYFVKTLGYWRLEFLLLRSQIMNTESSIWYDICRWLSYGTPARHFWFCRWEK